MGARQLGLSANNYVLLGVPTSPYPVLDVINHVLKLDDDTTLALCGSLFAKQLGFTLEDMQEGKAFSALNEHPALLIYDQDDKKVRLQHGLSIKHALPNATFITTEKLGHRKLMWDDEVVKRVVGFIEAH